MIKLTSSPWGAVQEQTMMAPGIYSVSTPSHGGIFVEPELWNTMKVKSTPYSQDGWFEEDCDWALVALAFPYAFSAEDVALAKRMATTGYFSGMEVA